MKKPAVNKAKKPASGEPMDEGADSAPHEKEERVDVEVAPQEREEKEADADVASREREEKEGVDANVDATRLDKTVEVSDDEENLPVEEVQLKSDELFENGDQSNENDVQTNGKEKSNGEFSNENDEVNGNDYDQVKIEELFDSIAIFLFFPNYKYRKKRRPGKLDQ